MQYGPILQDSFAGYRAAQTFQTPQQAATAMEDMCGWLAAKTDEPFPGPFLEYILAAYGEAAAQARAYPFAVLLAPNETLEWLLTPIGAVLQRRSYDLDVWDGFGDYDALALAVSRTPILPYQAAAKRLNWTGRALQRALAQLPAYLRPAQGVYRGVMLYLEGTRPGDDPIWWPRFTLTKKEMGMALVTF